MTAPDEIGEHRPDKYRGWLVFAHLPKELQDAEDATQEADYRRSRLIGSVAAPMMRGPWARPATDAERTLLAHLGFTLPERLVTWVSYPTATVRKRRWPQLETVEPPWTQAELAGMAPSQQFMDQWADLTEGEES
ncbi:hypothetical protein AU192_24720 [Mycobacterium lehmannii]|uniref:Uncharacterized protein n=1 Tax=Mycobacterium lehmannii TaxID=2048550 RepID=A0A117JJ55_9MYCO|nr:hypothetical protein [Mycobacterium lehmannii]KUI13388.1 hypothetical protein AU192_24720 [Mycobacterium lehmannii]